MGKTIYKKLMEVQANLKANKSRFNKFGGFSYRSAEDILEAVKPLLKQNGLVLVCSDSIENGTLTATYTLTDVDSGEAVTNSAVAIIGEHKGMSAEQNTGCASSYARKYALNGLFAIDDSSADPDSMETTHEKPKKDTLLETKKRLDSMETTHEKPKKDTLLETKKRLASAISEAGIKRANDVKELVAFMGIDTTSEDSIKEFLSLENVTETIKSAFARMHEQTF